MSNGTYFSVDGETQVSPWQPIQPRMNLPILETSITNSRQKRLAHGALFEGGDYETLANFSPVVTRVITENSALFSDEPAYTIKEWRPAVWDLISTVRIPEGLRQQMVVLPWQYRATNNQRGDARRFTDMSYTIYYSDTQDIIPPTIWEVQNKLTNNNRARTFTACPLGRKNGRALPLNFLIEVEVTDFSSVLRTVATYTTGDGAWETIDLTQQAADPNRWLGELPRQQGVTYFIQAR